MRSKFIAFAIGTAITLSSCSVSGEQDSTATPTLTASSVANTTLPPSTTLPATTTTEAATTTTLSELEQAQIAYFYASGEINGVTTREWDKACGSSGPNCNSLSWRAWRDFCVAVAPAIERFAAAVAAYKWPENAQDEADALVKRQALEAQIMYRCKDADSSSEIRAISKDLDALGEYGEASALRLALGLPINQG